MNHRHYALLFFSAVAVSGCASSPKPTTAPPADAPATAETPQTPAPSPAAEGDLVAQGKALYVEKCAGCHGDAGQGTTDAPPVVGAQALPLDPRPGQQRNVQFRTALDVLDWVKANMPPSGELSEEEAIAVIAFDLSANGVELPAEGLNRDTAAQIVLHP